MVGEIRTGETVTGIVHTLTTDIMAVGPDHGDTVLISPLVLVGEIHIITVTTEIIIPLSTITMGVMVTMALRTMEGVDLAPIMGLLIIEGKGLTTAWQSIGIIILLVQRQEMFAALQPVSLYDPHPLNRELYAQLAA